MSRDTAFAVVSYPPVGLDASDRADESARARGHAAGYLAGLRAASDEAVRLEAERAQAARESQARNEQRIDSAVAALVDATHAIQQLAAPVASDVRSSVGVVAVQIAEALIAAELSDPVRAAASAIARATSEVDPALIKAIRMHPADLAVLVDSETTPGGIRLIGDPALSPGDAVTEFDDGYLDASLATAVERVRQALGVDS